MEITPKTVVSVGIGTAFTIITALWLSVAKVQGAFNQLNINTQAIQDIGLAMELRGIDRVIESKSKEIRDKEIKAVNAKDNPELQQLLNEQIKKLHHEIEMQKVIRECVVDPTSKVCK
ncbi:MAG: hypothetical protein ACYTCV_12245 [Planctomycetota bacterium]|jgi:hypothetical protein